MDALVGALLELRSENRRTRTLNQRNTVFIIGLWQIRWIVTTYDGDLTVENAPEGGAVVTVTLPAADPPTHASTPTATAKAV
ncbi:MAG: hypothetical protein ABEJ82_09925 [Haloplanus sp.]